MLLGVRPWRPRVRARLLRVRTGGSRVRAWLLLLAGVRAWGCRVAALLLLLGIGAWSCLLLLGIGACLLLLGIGARSGLLLGVARRRRVAAAALVVAWSGAVLGAGVLGVACSGHLVGVLIGTWLLLLLLLLGVMGSHLVRILIAALLRMMSLVGTHLIGVLICSWLLLLLLRLLLLRLLLWLLWWLLLSMGLIGIHKPIRLSRVGWISTGLLLPCSWIGTGLLVLLRIGVSRLVRLVGRERVGRSSCNLFSCQSLSITRCSTSRTTIMSSTG